MPLIDHFTTENLFLASTYKAILERISKEALSKVEFRPLTKVTSITTERLAGHKNVERHPLVTVATSNNETRTFDEVVMTAPLGWLKQNAQIFSPPLDSRLQTSIEHISYGRLEKAYVTFPEAFWYISPSKPEDRKPFFTQYLAPDYTSHHWGIESVSLAALEPPHNHPTILFYMHGAAAEHVTSLANSLTPNTPEYLQKLDEFFRPYYSKLPSYSAHNPDCKPTDILATSWQNDELAGWGSYTNFQVSDPKEGVELDQDIKALRWGMPERGVWFAGEHTSPFVALGTVTG